MKTSQRHFWFMIVLTLLGAALRFADLNGRSMWLDEGFTLMRLNGTWQDVFTNVAIFQGIRTIDLHPPLFFALLKAWGELVGRSEYALKLIPAFASILLIPATYVLGHRLFNKRVALLAALLALLSPAYQYYGHELRMYTLVPLLAALTSYVVYLAVQPRRLRPYIWAAWIVLTAVSLFTHYSLLGLFAAQVMFAVVVIVRTRPRLHRRDVSILIAVVCAILLSAVVLGAGTDISYRLRVLMGGQSDVQSIVPLTDIAMNFINSALFGQNASDPTQGVVTVFVLLLCLLIMLFPNRMAPFRLDSGSHDRARLYVVLAAFAPLVFVFLLALVVDNRPSFRHSIPALPMAHVALAYLGAQAYGTLRKRNVKSPHAGKLVFGGVAGVGIVVVLAAQVYGMVATFVRTPVWQDDWRSAAQYIRDNWRPGDVLVVSLITPEDVLAVYLRDLPIPIVPVVSLPSSKADIKDVFSRYHRVWYTNTGGKPLTVATGLGQLLLDLHQRALVSFSAQTNILELHLYEVQNPLFHASPETAHQVPVTGRSSNHPSIAAYALQPSNPFHRYSNLRLTIYWRPPAEARNLSDYNVALRLNSLDGRTWADWFMPALPGAAPQNWVGERFYPVNYIIPIPVGLPRQPYELELAVGVGEKAEVVSVVRQPVTLAEVDCCVRIKRWFVSDAPAQQQSLWKSNDAAILAAEYLGALKPGELLPVALTWQLAQPSQAEWQVQLHLEGLLGGTVTQSLSPVDSADAPLKEWALGEAMRSLHSLSVPHQTRPGTYRLVLSRIASDGHELDKAVLGLVEVRDYPMTPVASTSQHPVSGQAGELTLLGYALDTPLERGTTLRYRLFWRVESPPTRDGVLFLHVMGPDGKPVAQDDNPPELGQRSTLTYRAGEGIEQLHRLVIPPDAPGGEYRLLAGVYNRADIVRWSAQQNGAPAQDDLLVLGTFTLPNLPEYSYKIYIPMVIQGE